MEGINRFQEARDAMVRDQIEQRGIRDPRLLEVMRRLPRHWFVAPDLRDRAYHLTALYCGSHDRSDGLER
jgi:protein-L-isoaspartate(D-aspartate) O-methyltransferase